MKYCHHFYNYLYIGHYNGNICICPWFDPSVAVIGNLFSDDIKDVYNSDYANSFRATMDDQTFEYCRRVACPFLQRDSLEDITVEEYGRRKRESYYPTIINLAYDYTCNQSCETCRKTVFVPPPVYAETMRLIKDKIAPYLDRAEKITASGHGDPFASGYMMECLESLRPTNSGLSISLETNGVFFDDVHWRRIQHLGEFRLEVIVTINSFDEFTYNRISRGGNYARVLQNLEFMSQLRRENKLFYLANTLVIQDRNFREIPSFIKRSFNSYAFDQVILRPVYKWRDLDDDVYWFKDVLNPLHPYHQEYLEIMQDPVLKDPRVYNFAGDTLHAARPYPVNARS